MSSTRTPQPRSTSFLVAIGCPHGAVPRRVELPIEEYQEDERRFVRVYLPDVDPDRVMVTLRGSALRLCCERRIEYPDCDSTAPHHVMFDKVMSVPAGTTPDDVAAEYGDGVLLVSWPTVPSSAQHTFPLTRCELPVE